MPNVQLGVPAAADDAGLGLVQAAKLVGHGDPVEGAWGHLGAVVLVGLCPTGLQKYGPDFGLQNTFLRYSKILPMSV